VEAIVRRRLGLLAILGIAFLASRAQAAGLGLRWDNCYADGGATNKLFACDTNLGSETLVGSVFLTKNAPQRSGVELVVSLAAAGATLPAWWQFKNAGTCRQTAAGINPIMPASSANCVDWASGNAAGGFAAYQIGPWGANSARIVAGFAVAQENIVDLSKGNEYYLFTMLIGNAKTVGTGACAGCDVPVCIVFSKATLATPLGILFNQAYENAINGTDSNFVTWQGGLGAGTVLGFGCPAATATRSSTWSTVKTLYR
jgi:hypothetical protein